MNILITGATGFLGSHLLEALLSSGHNMTILTRSVSDTWRVDHLLSQVDVYNIDLIDVDAVFKENKIDVVIHTACSYGRQNQSVYEIVESNVLFGLKVLDAAVSFNAGTFINTDTLLPKKLNDYSLSKKHFIDWLKQRSRAINVINLKLEHMYGPNDDRNKFVPWLINQLDQGVKRIPLTEGKQLRDFIYIDDVVSAYLLMLEKTDLLLEFNEFDVGTGNLTSVHDFVVDLYETYKILKQEPKTKLGFGEIPMRQGELMSVEVDNSGLKMLGWNAEISQSEGLKKIFREDK